MRCRSEQIRNFRSILPHEKTPPSPVRPFPFHLHAGVPAGTQAVEGRRRMIAKPKRSIRRAPVIPGSAATRDALATSLRRIETLAALLRAPSRMRQPTGGDCPRLKKLPEISFSLLRARDMRESPFTFHGDTPTHGPPHIQCWSSSTSRSAKSATKRVRGMTDFGLSRVRLRSGTLRVK